MKNNHQFRFVQLNHNDISALSEPIGLDKRKIVFKVQPTLKVTDRNRSATKKLGDQEEEAGEEPTNKSHPRRRIGKPTRTLPILIE